MNSPSHAELSQVGAEGFELQEITLNTFYIINVLNSFP